MNDLIEFLKIIIPSVVILAVVYIMMREFTKQNSKQINFLQKEQDLQRLKLSAEHQNNKSKISIPLKFQAYERMILFLERLNPENLIPRIINHNMTVGVLHSKLLAVIREEYEHNMSQQLYVSEKTWHLIVTAKEETIKLINTSSSGHKSDEKASVFAQEIISESSAKNNSINNAIAALKADIRDNFV